MSDKETTPGFAADVEPLFTEIDKDHMSFMFDLGSYEDVKAHAVDIYDAVSAGRMPPDEPWAEEKVATFKAWMDDGFQP